MNRTETSNERFKRIGEKRTNNVLTDLRRLSIIFNRNRWDYTDEQAKKIIKRLEVEIKKLKDKSYSEQNNVFKWKEDNE
jgi:hypothetical protein